MTNNERRKLDARVAEEVMGFAWKAGFDHNGQNPHRILLPPDSPRRAVRDIEGGDVPKYADWDRWVSCYSTRIADAWKVVEAMRKRGWGLKLEANRLHQSCGGMIVSGGRKTPNNRVYFKHEDGRSGKVFAEKSAPLAICHAALETIRAEQTEEA